MLISDTCKLADDLREKVFDLLKTFENDNDSILDVRCRMVIASEVLAYVKDKIDNELKKNVTSS